MQIVEGFGAMTTQQAQQVIDQRSSVLESAGSHEYPEFELMMQSKTAHHLKLLSTINIKHMHGHINESTDMTHDTYTNKKKSKLRENSRDMAILCNITNRWEKWEKIKRHGARHYKIIWPGSRACWCRRTLWSHDLSGTQSGEC